MACQDCVNFLLSIDKFKEKIIATHWKLHKRIMTVTEPKENKGKKLDPVLIDDKDEETNIRAKSPSTADDGLIEDIPDLFCSDDEIEMEEKSSEFQKPSDTPAPVPSHSVKEPPTISLSANNPENPGETQEEKEDSDEDFLPEVPPPSTFIKEDKSKRWRYPKEMQVRLAAEDKLEEEMYRMGLFKCRICLEVTGNLTLLTKHVRTKHNPTEYIFCCTQNLRSAGRVHLFDHIREHLDQDVFKCQHCPARFSVRTRLHAHLYRFHPKEKNRMFLCDTCGRGFAIKGQLDQHVKVKHNSTEWKCDRCDKGESLGNDKGVIN